MYSSPSTYRRVRKDRATSLDTDLLVIIGVTVLVTLVCAAVEQRIQELRTVGRSALVATFLPSALW